VSLTAAVLGATGASAAAVASGILLRRWLRRVRRLRAQVLAVTLLSLGIAAAVAATLAREMVLEADEFRIVLAVLAVTAWLATILVVTATSTLGDDVRRLERTVRAIEAGHRDVRTGVERADELGHVARALDDAVVRLDALETTRAIDDERRVAMFSSISHDLRTPLAALQAALEAFEDGLVADADRYLGSMRRDVDALAALVDDLFLLARIESGDLAMVRSSVDLAELADDAVEALAPVAAAREVELRADTQDPVIVEGNATALSRIIRNLVDNAVRHSPRGATVDVTVEPTPQPTVRVHDRGPGFPEGFAEVAFERFSRADPSRRRSTGGAGLGLAIAHGLVVAHDGTIWIDSHADGASVTFALPRAASGSRAGAEQPT
jgi:signal transduction histidine kinase